MTGKNFISVLVKVFVINQWLWGLISADCIEGSTIHNVQFSERISGRLTGPIIGKSLVVIDERACEEACFMDVHYRCYMFNYRARGSICQLLYKDLPDRYRFLNREQSNWVFRTRKCVSDPCNPQGGLCYSLSDPSQQACWCKPGYKGTMCNTGLTVNIGGKK